MGFVWPSEPVPCVNQDLFPVDHPAVLAFAFAFASPFLTPFLLLFPLDSLRSGGGVLIGAAAELILGRRCKIATTSCRTVEYSCSASSRFQFSSSTSWQIFSIRRRSAHMSSDKFGERSSLSAAYCWRSNVFCAMPNDILHRARRRCCGFAGSGCARGPLTKKASSICGTSSQLI